MASRRDDVSGNFVQTALLFDLDGTLVDTDALHLIAFQNVLAAHGIKLTKAQYVETIMGSSNAMIGAAFLPHLSPADRDAILATKEAAFRDMLGELKPVAGVMALLDYADAQGVKCAVVTNAPRANAKVVLDALGLAARLPIQIIGGELARPKPDPLPYLTGLALTGADAAHSLAFEDSLSGLRAAVGAGLTVVGLTTTLDETTLTRAGATIAAADFTDPRIRELIRQKMIYTRSSAR
ncbi:HAD family phosphatase [Methylocapsa sp. S129]|uniref:HAD family hydrolase n=1 Tax=Methylocapsa sp. S129 TaxID=1641869 RepID=UPI001FEFB3CF|nr:HAD-IA family hydrolase [Methylocapsa sp. S129]